MVIVQGASPYFSTSRAKLDVQATTSVSFYNIAPGLDVTLFGTLPDVASAAKVFSLPFNLGGNSQLAKVQMYIMARLSTVAIGRSSCRQNVHLQACSPWPCKLRCMCGCTRLLRLERGTVCEDTHVCCRCLLTTWCLT